MKTLLWLRSFLFVRKKNHRLANPFSGHPLLRLKSRLILLGPGRSILSDSNNRITRIMRSNLIYTAQWNCCLHCLYNHTARRCTRTKIRIILHLFMAGIYLYEEKNGRWKHRLADLLFRRRKKFSVPFWEWLSGIDAVIF